MAYWLVKSEPGTWSWDDHDKAGVAEWDGVRNHQACEQHEGHEDRATKAFFYHSVSRQVQMVGMLEVVQHVLSRPQRSLGPLRHGRLQGACGRWQSRSPSRKSRPTSGSTTLALVRHSRLSVMPIDRRGMARHLPEGRHRCLRGTGSGSSHRDGGRDLSMDEHAGRRSRCSAASTISPTGARTDSSSRVGGRRNLSVMADPQGRPRLRLRQ